MKKFLVIGLFIFLETFLTSPVLAENDSQPTRILIPSVQINLPVKEAEIKNDTWLVRTDSASFGKGSAFPGKSGNTVIFSHALSKLFGRLPMVKIGDKVHVFTKNDWFVYQIENVRNVEPEQTDEILSNKIQGLTLYTCQGDNNKERFVAHAKLLYKK